MILFGLLLSAAFLPIPLIGPAVVPRWWLLAAATPLMLLMTKPRLWGDSHVLWFATLVWAALSLNLTPDIGTGTGALIHLCILFGVFVLGYASERADVGMFVTGMALGLVPSAIIAAAQAAGMHPVAETLTASPSGLFYNRNILAETAAPLAGWALLRCPWWFALAPASCLILAHDRAAVLGLMVAGFIGVFGGMSKRWQASIAGAAMAGLAIAALVVLTLYSPWGLTSIGGRLSILRNLWADHAWWGRGIGSFPALYLPNGETAHSDALQLLFELGPGAVPLLIVFAWGAWNAAKSRTAEGLVFIALLVEGIVSFPLQMPATGALTALLAGHLVRAGVPLRAGQPDLRAAGNGLAGPAIQIPPAAFGGTASHPVVVAVRCEDQQPATPVR